MYFISFKNSYVFGIVDKPSLMRNSFTILDTILKVLRGEVVFCKNHPVKTSNAVILDLLVMAALGV